MKALVTGASGFIGSTLIEELNARGFEVFALMRKTSSASNLMGLKYERREGDLSDLRSLKAAVKGMDYVFHLAGTVFGPNRKYFFEHNAEGTRRLAEAVAEDCPDLKRFVFISSLAAGGPSASLVPRTEADSDAPVSAYGWSKLSAEHTLLKFKERYPISILRPPMVYGPRDKATFVFVKTVAGNVVPMLRGGSPDGHKYFTAIHVRDLVAGVIASALVPVSKVASGEMFYLTQNDVFSYEKMMDTIAENLGKNPWKLPVPQWVLTFAAYVLSAVTKMTRRVYSLNRDKLNEIRADYWICSSAKAHEKLGFTPEYDLARGLADSVGWYKNQGWIR